MTDTLGAIIVNEAPAIASIVLVFFNDILYKIYGDNIVWHAIEKSSKDDPDRISKTFAKENILLDRLKAYFNYGGDVFGLCIDHRLGNHCCGFLC